MHDVWVCVRLNEALLDTVLWGLVIDCDPKFKWNKLDIAKKYLFYAGLFVLYCDCIHL